MNLRARVKWLERLHHLHADAKISFDVLDRVVDGTISDEEFEQWTPFWDEILAYSEITDEIDCSLR